MTRAYEMIVVLSPKLGDEGIASKTSQLRSLIEATATIDVVETIGMRRLAYEIDDQKEGFYIQFDFSADPEVLKELDRKLKITEGILRFLIVRKEA